MAAINEGTPQRQTRARATSDRTLALDPLQDLQQLHSLPSPTAPSQPEVIESSSSLHDTARYGTFPYPEVQNDREDVGSQHSTAYTALLDVTLESRSSSDAENSETNIEALHRHVPDSDESNDRRAPGSALSEHDRGTTLSFRFGSMLVLINGLIQKLGELPEIELSEKELPKKDLPGKKLPYTRLGDIINFLEGCVLDLQIWLKDLTTTEVLALDRLDDMKNPQIAATVIIASLHETMASIGNILLPATKRFNTSLSSESASVHPQASIVQSHRGHMEVASASSYGETLVELSMTCDALKSLLGKLLAQKSAIKEVLASSSTERITSTKDIASDSEARLAPSILCFGW